MFLIFFLISRHHITIYSSSYSCWLFGSYNCWLFDSLRMLPFLPNVPSSSILGCLSMTFVDSITSLVRPVKVAASSCLKQELPSFASGFIPQYYISLGLFLFHLLMTLPVHLWLLLTLLRACLVCQSLTSLETESHQDNEVPVIREE